MQLYVGHDQRIDAVLQTDGIIDGARAAYLTGAIADHDRDLGAELEATARAIEEREAQLRAQRRRISSRRSTASRRSRSCS